jgi:iron complex outermembrane receptor protein
MTFDKRNLLATTVIAGIAMLGVVSAASAQTAKPAPKAEEPAANEVEELVVTGSRIKRSEFNSASPVTVITSESAELQGQVDTASILQSSILGSTSQQINNNFTGFVTTGGNGANTLSLRGLGAQRSLTLINGRRAGPAGIGGTVGPFDLNVIPSSVVDRTEILTGGASSIYGSDAIAGVVNIMTKRNSDDGEMAVYANVPFSKGGEVYRANISKGWTFSRGYLNVAGDYYQSNGLRFKDRDYLNCPQDYTFDPVTGARRDLVMPDGSYKCLNTLTGIYIRGTARYIPDAAAVSNGWDLNGFRRVNGSLATVTADVRADLAGTQSAYSIYCGSSTAGNCSSPLAFARANQALQTTDSPLQGYRHAVSPVTRKSFFASGGFDLTEKTEIYGELLLNRRESEQRSIRQIGPTINANNPTNPFNFANNPSYVGPTGAPLAASAFSPIFVLPVTRDQTVDYARAVLGVRGVLPESLPVLGNWDWDIYGQYSKSSGDYGQDFIYNDRMLAVSGAARCNQALVTISANMPNATCPTNIDLGKVSTVGGSYLTPEEYAFLNGYEQGHTEYVYQYVEGSISGDLFKLPAGMVGAAVGFQLRKESLDDVPGYNSRNSNYNGSAASAETHGSDEVKELFGELEVPLLKNLPLVDSLTLNYSARYSDYKSYGSSSTYKAGLKWNINSTWALRANKGTSFRAPALYELYLGSSSSFLAQTSDPCYQYGTTAGVTDRQRANCAALGIAANSTHGGAGSYTIFAKGGVGYLEAEESDNKSIGIVFTPSFIDLNVSLDYSELTVNNQVQRYGAANILDSCLDAPDFPTSAYCSLITRNTDTSSPTFGAVLTVSDAYLNVAKQWNNALDLSAVYRHELPHGTLTVSGQFTWTLDWYTQLSNGADPVKNQGFTAYPDFAGRTGVSYNQGDWTVTWATQMVGKTSDVDDSYSGYGTDIITYRDQTAYVKRHIEFNATHDISVRRKFDDITVIAGINNVFDEQPPFYSSSSASRFSNMRLASSYDILGRRMFVNVSKKW